MIIILSSLLFSDPQMTPNDSLGQSRTPVGLTSLRTSNASFPHGEFTFSWWSPIPMGSSLGTPWCFRVTVQEPCCYLITELCGAKHVGYFGPTQFYVALKLIAAAQSGLPVRIESIKRELPLPRFVGLKNDSEMRYGNPAELHGAKFQVPYAAMEKNTFKRTDDGEKQEPKSPVSPLGSPPASPSDYQRTPLGYGYGRRRSGVEQQRGAPCEARQPGLPQDAPPAGHQGTKQTRRHASLTRSLSVDREARESSSDYPDDPWRITEEQREYYVNQFKSLEPDLNAFISGSVAKNFFTKSKLSIPELSYICRKPCDSRIFSDGGSPLAKSSRESRRNRECSSECRELSDADCDGALTLPEFCAAFHLIVARKNGYPLPETLPQTLQPDYLQAAFHMLQRDGASYDPYAESTAGSQLPRDVSRIEPPVEKMPEKTTQLRDVKTEEKQASRVSVVDQTLRQDLFPGPAAQKEANSLKARPRSRSYSSTSIEEAVKRGEEPPTPPPRPQKSHSRASSLDLNKVFQPGTPVAKSGWLPRPPALPPRPHMSQAEQVLKMELQPQLSRTPSQTEENSPVKKDPPHAPPPSKPIRRKFRPEHQAADRAEHPPATGSAGPPPPPAKPQPTVPKQSSKQKKAIQTAIRKNKEANAVLVRLNSELQQQLKEAHQERTALESQLEQLRPVTVL
uniref:RALBP1 associated Eps domain containing 2 n=1 Tax=Ornithorhynchus anatinus TaxID=9258 RepID=A0A6I8NEI9_ORNAN